MERRLIPAREARAEIRVINSRFIATAGPAFSVADARAFIARVSSEFADATHNVPAYIIGHGSSVIAHCTDAGEPSGTAGPPALAVLRGSGLGDVAVVVTRYFGGTKLGTGGLVRAYGDAVREVLVVLPRAVKVPTYTVRLEIPYALLDVVRRAVAAHHGRVLDEVFSAQVTMTVQLAQAELDGFERAVLQVSRGAIRPDVVESCDSTAMPVDVN